MKYTKMHGAGNGFVVIDNYIKPQGGSAYAPLSDEECCRLAVILCEKEHTDGLLAVCPCDDADFGMLYINADGSIGEMCGNGARCIARYGYEHGYADNPDEIRFRATAGIVTGKKISEEIYEVRINDPSVIDLHRTAYARGQEWDCSYIELGNPGIPVVTVEVPSEDFTDICELRQRGRELRHCPVFPKGANITFVSPPVGNRVRAITFERGVEDFTLACGTGSSGAAITLVLRGRIPEAAAELQVPGGLLSVRFSRDGDCIHDVFLTGPTAYVSEGEY